MKGKKPSQKKADAAFERLIAAGRRPLDVIYRREGIPNKDKAKFESQINNLLINGIVGNSEKEKITDGRNLIRGFL